MPIKSHEIAALRQAYILVRLKKNGYVDFDDVRHVMREALGVKKVATAQFQRDVKFLESLEGIEIESSKGKIELAQFSRLAAKQEKNRQSKEAIAKMARGLILGEEWAKKAVTKGMGCHYRFQELWGKTTHRSFAIDSGSTTIALAARLLRLPLPNPELGLMHLDVYTNSRRIFGMLGRMGCQIKTVMIGGSQYGDTEAVTGELANRCVEAWNPRFSVALVGASSVDYADGVASCLDHEDARMKSEFLARSSLRILLADNSKFARDPLERRSPFSRLDPSCIDLIITDELPDLTSLGIGSTDPKEDASEILQSLPSIPIIAASGYPECRD